ncbi:MAG: undecaprenyl/decaprenyl-phosphate alpha-N-acetylglucosaminyl 1-phosphate transferase [Anaerolineales bacterium]|nr:undecaprenyl/decaprenyl-phosphate alpha-N-acetylglucosaminyl 1-phosphate transferase [Anaerolineales bacterium]
MTRLVDLFPIILIAAVTAVFTAPVVIRVAKSMNLVDIPKSEPHKTHTKPTPMAGGFLITLAVAAAYLITRPEVDNEILGILFGSIVIATVGIVDDLRKISPVGKLLAQILAASVVIYFGVQVKMTRIPWLDLFVTYLWIVGITNAFNFVDSHDGLALGLAGISSSFFMLVTLDTEQTALAALSAALVGAALGGFLFNARPAKMFLGDSGAQLLGFVLAGIGVAYTPAKAGLPQAISWFVPILVLGLPVFDMILVVYARLRNKNNIFQGGQDHTYHRLVSFGLDPMRAVLAMQLASVLLGLTAFILLETTVLLANTAFGLIVLAGLFVSLFLVRQDINLN